MHRYPDTEGIQHTGQQQIYRHVLERIIHRIFLLTDNIRKQGYHSITGYRSPGRSHITVRRHQPDVQSQNHRTADEGEIGSPLGLIRQLVPEGQVEVDALEDFGQHHDSRWLPRSVPPNSRGPPYSAEYPYSPSPPERPAMRR